MSQIKVLGEFFFSKALNTRIYDSQGRLVGRIKDMTITRNGTSPTVTCIKFEKDPQKHLDISQVNQWDKTGMRLKETIANVYTRTLKSDEIYIGKWLMDKQIIDLAGSKLVRVNDIRLSWVQHGQHKEIIMSAIDIGLKGVLRRLGLEFLLKNRPNQFLGWQYFAPLGKRTGNLYIKENFDKLNQLHPVDIAEIIEELGYEERRGLLRAMNNEKIADVITEMEFATQIKLFESMDIQKASDILEEMQSDNVADILSELPAEKSEEIITRMNPEDIKDMRELMSYPNGTAGALMTNEYISLPDYLTAQETIEQLRQLADKAETIYYIYVVDEKEVLLGVLSLRELIIAKPHVPLAELMHTKVRSIRAAEDYRKAVGIAAKYSLLALPVLNDHGQILGIITIDDVIKTIMPDRSGFKTFSQYVLTARKG